MTILALTKAHQAQVQQLFTDANFFSAEWFFSPKQLFFGFFDQKNTLSGIIHIELYHNMIILKGLTTRKTHRNQGIARALISHLESTATELSYENIFVFTKYGANYLECAGFEQTIIQKLPNHLKDYITTNKLNNAIIMKKKLPLIKKRLTRQESYQIQTPLRCLAA